MKCILTIIAVMSMLQKQVLTKTVLQNILDYRAPDLRPLKKHIGYYEDTYLNFTELATKYGYPAEEHTITTEDGYILTVFRILPNCNKAKGYPVLLMHGIVDSSDGWLIPGPKEALGYILSDNCYDVWASNNRGNYYSRKHIRLNPDRDRKYWNFSFEESGYYDIPAVIDYMLAVTKYRKIFYIGHSQGTTDFFVMGSLRPEYNDKVRLSIHLAPVAWLNNLRTPISALATFEEEIAFLLRNAGIQELAPKNGYFPHEVVEFLCQIAPLQVCGTIGFFIGDVYGVIKPRTLSVLYGHVLFGFSVKTARHYGQVVKSQRFQRFDEGRKGNLKKYGTVETPLYNVTKISSPTVLIGSKHDWISDLKDVEKLGSKLPNLLETYIVSDPVWSHNTHLWGSNATEYVYFKILKYFNDYSDTEYFNILRI